ncbi:hypothetical protein CDD81_6361 [Ophiocordyceps australis]|uniref:Major facilitator superfamily (MFS) profile domain-containing protein n=1 Tax=Ophiocordyceps australis TaxID=1399860 RepID=A0A2C5Y6H4_9HYPO|nr:hypothetical protein CDD81_6361 [Ophiocordyceps australis]
MTSSSIQAPLTPGASEDSSERRALLKNNDVDKWQTSKSSWHLLMLALGIGGLQIAWSVELSNGSPYLLSLGLSKSLMALVWMAGPLTGTLVVPYVGIVSDNCRIAWGRRRPFLIGGTVATILGLLFLAWTKEIVGGVLGLFGVDASCRGCSIAVIVAAVITIYVLDVAINTVQAAVRALMVDCAPSHQQEQVNAMASRLTGVGNIIGFLAGYSDLPRHLWFLGNSQFKILCAIAAVALGLSVAISASVITERNPRDAASPPRKTPHIFSFFFNIFKSMRRLPPRTKRVCQVQFCAWVGFFPLLFYTSSYIGEIYVQPYLEANPNMTRQQLDKLYEQATRIGTFALLANAIVSLTTNVFLPVFIAPSFDKVACVDQGDSSGAKQTSALEKLRIPGFTIRRAWYLSLLLFAAVMFCTPFVRSVRAATVLIALAGVTWAMALWAPWAIISAEISQRDALDRASRLRAARGHGRQGSSLAETALLDSGDMQSAARDSDQGREQVDEAGVILGIHNMAIALPQIVATVGSSLVFKIWQKPRGTPGDNSIGIVMALGGACVLASCVFATRIDDGAGIDVEDVEQG